MKKANCNAFVNILNTIHDMGITTKAGLMVDQLLYTEFWFALKDFCHFALLSKTSGKNAKGEILPGNTGKIDVLEIRSATTRDEIETDCAIKIIEKLDLVLRQPIEKQKNYCYTICNNMVNDCFRRLPPDDFKIVSLNGTIEGTSVAAEDAYTYEDIIADDTYNPERLHVEHETIKELKKEKQAAEILMNYCTSMGKYFADQSAIDTLMDVAIDSQNSVDEKAAEIIPDLAEEASTVTGETTDEFLKGFHESEEYAAALVAYRNRLETESRILEETDPETPDE